MAPSKGTSRLFCQGWRLELPRSPASFSLISVQPKRNLSHHSKPRPSVESPPRPGIAEAIAQHAQLRRVAFVSSTSDENDPRELSYQQLLDDSRTIEEGLKACPFPDRNHGGPFRNEAAGAWALQATSTYRFATQLLGILDGHHVAVPVKPGLPQPELDYILQDSNAWPIDPQDLGIRSAHRSGGSRIWQAAQSIRSDPEHEPGSRTGRGSRETAGQAATTSDISSGVMLYTSGTTSRPASTSLKDLRVESDRWCRKVCCSLRKCWQLNVNH